MDLAQYRVSAVKYNGKLYYVFPTAKKDKIYVGKQKQFNAYKEALRRGWRPASGPAGSARATADEPAPRCPHYETAGPEHIEFSSSMVLVRWARRL